MSMKVDLLTFMENNASIDFFNIEDARLFYNLVETEDLPSAIRVLIPYFEGIGWSNINIALGYLPVPYNPIYKEILNSHLDDYVFNLNMIKGMENLYGNYLLADLFYVDTNDIGVKKVDTFLLTFAFRAGNSKNVFLKEVNDDLNANVNSTDRDYMTRVFLYHLFLKQCLGDEVAMTQLRVANEVTRLKPRFIIMLNYINEILYDRESPLISRLGMMRILHQVDYKKFIHAHLEKNYLNLVFSLLDIVD